MRIVIPPALRPGDRIGVAAPGGPVDRRAVERGIAVLEQRGFEIERGEHLMDRLAYLAGADVDRARDLNRMLADPDLRAVWFARGGYGSHRIVGDLDFAALRRSPKWLVGYSDVTVLHAAARRRAGIAGMHGPLVAELGDRRAYDAPALGRALGGSPLRFRLRRRTIVRAGRGEGPLLGGCLAVLVALLGTPDEIDLRGAVLFWEDVNEPPYRIDRMLAQLRLAGHLRGLKGMVVGRLLNCRPADRASDLPLEEILATHLEGTRYPVVVDFPAGHAPGSVTLPLGPVARLDATAGRLTIAGF
jgi:muramoyltetrapeptide carboxypeptidase